jgi:hypothetical protein
METSWASGAAGRGLVAWIRSPLRVTLTAETWTSLILAAGVVLRVLEYTDNRQLYMDESALMANLVDLSVFDFRTVLTENQLAAPGFLVVERLMVRLPLGAVWAARLVPCLCAIASMFLMRAVARRYVTRQAVPIALGLYALNDWLLYYAAEIKQYSSDVALALCALLLAAAPAGISRRSLLALAAVGAVGVWFSHPLSLVLAGVGTYLIGAAAIRKEWRKALRFVGLSLMWAISFAACYMVSHSILEKKDPFIWIWWDFAFLPLPPRSLLDLRRDFWHVVNVFNNPSWVVTPLGVLASALVALALFSIGALSLGLRWRGGVYLLLAPLMFALVASGLHQYPFHGRLLLFLVPGVHLLVAEGAVALARCGGALVTLVLGTLRQDCARVMPPRARTILIFLLGAFMLVQPASDVFWHRFIMRRIHGQFDSHGDLSPDVLDYLEKLEKIAQRAQSRP